MQFIVINGNAGQGSNFYGPFLTEEAATTFIETYPVLLEASLALIQTPERFAQNFQVAQQRRLKRLKAQREEMAYTERVNNQEKEKEVQSA